MRHPIRKLILILSVILDILVLGIIAYALYRIYTGAAFSWDFLMPWTWLRTEPIAIPFVGGGI